MSQSDTDSQYVVVSVLDYGKGGEGAVIGRSETLDGAHKLGETGAPDGPTLGTESTAAARWSWKYR